MPQHEPHTPVGETEIGAKVAAAGRDVPRLKALAAAHPKSIGPWLALAEVVYRPDSPVTSYAYARLAEERARAVLEAAGWLAGQVLPEGVVAADEALRAFFIAARAARSLGLREEDRALTGIVKAADPDALPRLEAALPVPPAPPTETIVIRGAD